MILVVFLTSLDKFCYEVHSSNMLRLLGQRPCISSVGVYNMRMSIKVINPQNGQGKAWVGVTGQKYLLLNYTLQNVDNRYPVKAYVSNKLPRMLLD